MYTDPHIAHQQQSTKYLPAADQFTITNGTTPPSNGQSNRKSSGISVLDLLNDPITPAHLTSTDQSSSSIFSDISRDGTPSNSPLPHPCSDISVPRSVGTPTLSNPSTYPSPYTSPPSIPSLPDSQAWSSIPTPPPPPPPSIPTKIDRIHAPRQPYSLSAPVPISKPARNCRGYSSDGHRGPWLEHEDKKLKQLVKQLGPTQWSEIAAHLPNRSGKQVRERWINQLKPELKKKNWTVEEDCTILQAHRDLGNKWAVIASLMKGRTDNAVKNRYNSTLIRAIREYTREKGDCALMNGAKGNAGWLIDEVIRDIVTVLHKRSSLVKMRNRDRELRREMRRKALDKNTDKDKQSRLVNGRKCDAANVAQIVHQYPQAQQQQEQPMSHTYQHYHQPQYQLHGPQLTQHEETRTRHMVQQVVPSNAKVTCHSNRSSFSYLLNAVNTVAHADIPPTSNF